MSFHDSRKRFSSERENTDDMICNFGAKCYRRNPIHLKEFRHPHLETLVMQQIKGCDIRLPHNFNPPIDKEVVIDQIKIMVSQRIGPQPKDRESHDDSKKPKLDENKLNDINLNENHSYKAPILPTSKNASNENNAKRKDETHSNSHSTKRYSSSNDSKEASSSKMNKEEKKASLPNINEYFPVVLPKGKMAGKLEAAAPYNIFYTTVTDCKATHTDPLSVTFQDLLDKSLGNLKASLQINFMVDIAWLMAQYYFAGYRDKPLTILYGEDEDDLRNVQKKIPNVTTIKIQMPNAFGKHHTKMSMFLYEDNSIRIVVSTANLYEPDWDNRTQGLWISPKCPPLNPNRSSTSAGNGPTNFKNDLLQYLHSYKLSHLSEWIHRVRETDFSHINVFLIASIPGQHRGPDYDRFGHLKLASVLSQHCVIPKAPGDDPSSWTVISQCSSIGSLGNTADSWLRGEFRRSLSKETTKSLMNQPKISVVYPSLDNVKQSHDKLLGGGCLPYRREQHMKQQWFENFLCQWKANIRNRNQAMPHIKTYCRVSPTLTEMAWFVLTSANLSKAAWGFVPQSSVDTRLNIRSYELGVLLLPKFITGESVFKLRNKYTDMNVNKNTKFFPFPYDLPLTPYNVEDGPFFMNYMEG